MEIEGYKLYRKDRERIKSKHGRASWGVTLYIWSDIALLFKTVHDFSSGVNEALTVYSEKLNLILCILYRQPTNQKHESDAPEFFELMSSIQTS